MTFVLVLTTVNADFDARALAHALVERRLAACVNIMQSVHSVYRWKDQVADDEEQLLLIKTSEERLDELREELLRLHPYEVPELVVLPITSTSSAYGAWLLQSVTREGSPRTHSAGFALQPKKG